MYDILINTFGFPIANVHLRIATIGNAADGINAKDVENELNWLITNAIPGDIAVFYYAGHGSQESGGIDRLLAHDLDGGILDSVFAGYINKINTQKLVVILDMSFSGGFITDGQMLNKV